jgi:acyl-CoA thioesterase II
MSASPVFVPLMTLQCNGSDRFIGAAAPDKGERMFGGQFLAQCIRAAQMSVPDDRVVHSLHAYFLRPGDSDLPIDIVVERVRDGRAFSSREVRASQHGKELFRVTMSLQIADDSPVYAGMQMPDVLSPEDTPTNYIDFTEHELGDPNWHGKHRPIDILYVNPPPAMRDIPITTDQLMWIKVRDALPEDPALHLAGIAYISDATLIDHVMLPHGLRWHDAGFNGSSLDHSMWFHHPARADDWLLFVQHVEATGRGRGLASGHFFDRTGQLIARCVQEGLMRWS